MVRPRISSAEKVATQKRRRQLSGSSSSSARSPAPKKQTPLPKIRGKPDWNTKPRAEFANRGKITSLNDHNNVLTSDPEDSDYDPNSQPQNSEIPGAKDTSFRIRSKPPIRLPTPEWEKPDWEGPTYTTISSTRGKPMARRGMSGRGSLPDRQALRRRSSGYGNSDNIYPDSPSYWNDDDDYPARMGSQIHVKSAGGGQRYASTSDTQEKRRDSQGLLLRPNGKVDGRSLRHLRAREAMAKIHTPERGPEGEKKGYYQRSSEALAKWKAMEREKEKVEKAGQQQGLGSTNADANPDGYVDAAALAKAGYDVLAKPGTPTPMNGTSTSSGGILNQTATDGRATGGDGSKAKGIPMRSS